MEGSNKFPAPGEGPIEDAQETRGEILGFKEVLAMLDEMKADEAAVLEVIDQVLLEPMPDLHDEVAKEEFRQKMKTLRIAAETSALTTARLREIEQRITARMDEIEQGS